MTVKERIRQLEEENAALRGQLAEALERLGQALERIHRLKGRLAKDSHTSLKPPSSADSRSKRKSQHHTSEKLRGGQPGQADRSLIQVASLDEVVCQRP